MHDNNLNFTHKFGNIGVNDMGCEMRLISV